MDSAVPLRPMLQRDAASAALGMRLLVDEPGRAVVELVIRPDHLNGHGVTHGGIVFALADTAFAIACNVTDAVTVASGGDIAFLRPTGAGDVLTATATPRALVGRSGVYDVEVLDQEGRIVAEYRGRSRTTDRRPPG